MREVVLIKESDMFDEERGGNWGISKSGLVPCGKMW